MCLVLGRTIQWTPRCCQGSRLWHPCRYDQIMDAAVVCVCGNATPFVSMCVMFVFVVRRRSQTRVAEGSHLAWHSARSSISTQSVWFLSFGRTQQQQQHISVCHTAILTDSLPASDPTTRPPVTSHSDVICPQSQLVANPRRGPSLDPAIPHPQGSDFPVPWPSPGPPSERGKSEHGPPGSKYHGHDGPPGLDPKERNI